MLAKLTTKSQLTLPKAVATRFPGVGYIEVSTDGGSIILRPLQRSRIDEIWTHLEKSGITEEDLSGAVAWSRQGE